MLGKEKCCSLNRKRLTLYVVFSPKIAQKGKPMTVLSHTEKKNPRKYNTHSREKQAAVIDESFQFSQRKLAEKHGVPRSTLQNWLTRSQELKGQIDPNVVDFFESTSGQSWLHGLVVAVLLVLHECGNVGHPLLHLFFKLAGINKFVGTSIKSLQDISKKLQSHIIEFGETETERLAHNMPFKNICGALDENFIFNEMTLILMEPISGYILAEEAQKKRDAKTWHEVTQNATKGLKVHIQQLVGDEAGGLTKLATSILNIVKAPDLFHIQQDITKGLTAPLARNAQLAKKQVEALDKEQTEMLDKLASNLEGPDEEEEFSNSSVKAAKRAIEIGKLKKTHLYAIQDAEKRCEDARQVRRSITDIYHPFNLDTGETQTPESVKEQLESFYATLESIGSEAGCTDKQMEKVGKAKKLIGSMTNVIAFFFSNLGSTVKLLELHKPNEELFIKLVSIEYLKICLKKAKKKKQKDRIRNTVERLDKESKTCDLWNLLKDVEQTTWMRKALECAQIFQRSSSCVEGRNGQLALKHHAFRRLNERTLKVLTIVHNYFIKGDGNTTAAERFFEQETKDLYTHLLGKIDLPRPREKHTRRAKIELEKDAA
jgi:hypothetical protein